MQLASTANFSQVFYARFLIVSGFCSRIVQIESGMTYKQIRRLIKDLQQTGDVNQIQKSRSTRSAATIIKNLPTKIQASTLMHLYTTIAGEGAYDSIDIKALIEAHNIYTSISSEIQEIDESIQCSIDIADAWCLANELRSYMAYMEQCSDCSNVYYSSCSERAYYQCPYCHHETAKNRKNSSKSKHINKSITTSKLETNQEPHHPENIFELQPKSLLVQRA